MRMLIDGNNLVWRSSSQVVLTHNGMRTEVAFLGMKQLMSYLTKFKPAAVLVVWDGGHDERRTRVLPEYKKWKELSPEEVDELEAFYVQVGYFQEFLTIVGIPQIKCIGREADDIIFSYVRAYCREGVGEIVIVSNDTDYVQLLGVDGLKIYSPRKHTITTEQSFREEYGFAPASYPRYKAIVGGHDGFPGIKGLGAKRAKEVVAYLEAAREGKVVERDSKITVERDSKIIVERDSKIMGMYSARPKEFEEIVKIAGFLLVSGQEMVDGQFGKLGYGQSFDAWEKGVKEALEFFGFKMWFEHFEDVFKPAFANSFVGDWED